MLATCHLKFYKERIKIMGTKPAQMNTLLLAIGVVLLFCPGQCHGFWGGGACGIFGKPWCHKPDMKYSGCQSIGPHSCGIGNYRVYILAFNLTADPEYTRIPVGSENIPEHTQRNFYKSMGLSLFSGSACCVLYSILIFLHMDAAHVCYFACFLILRQD